MKSFQYFPIITQIIFVIIYFTAKSVRFLKCFYILRNIYIILLKQESYPIPEESTDNPHSVFNMHINNNHIEGHSYVYNIQNCKFPK